MEARLHGYVNEEMYEATDTDEKFAILARASQATFVALDAMTVREQHFKSAMLTTPFINRCSFPRSLENVRAWSVNLGV